MVRSEHIPIANIYQMLAYAFQNLKQDDYAHLAAERFSNIYHLIAAILILGVNRLIKRGLLREYIAHHEMLTSPRGKIDFSSSLRHAHSRCLFCHFDEYSENFLLNRIIKTCICWLLRSASELHKDKKAALKKLLYYFDGIAEIEIQEIQWKSLNWHRHNSEYSMLIYLCQLLLEGLLQNEETGKYRLATWLDEQQMHSLYQRFLFAYFQREFPQLTVKSPQIPWKLSDDCSEFYLPSMNTDVVLSLGDRHLIIEAKYYKNPMQKSYHSDKETFHSNNLYQVYSYVKNMAANKYNNTISGLLLYAKTKFNYAPDGNYYMDGNLIMVRSLDLSINWSEIKAQLDAIAQLV